MSQDPKSSWWHTAPGILTAIAALLTALTGMLVAVHQTGLFDRPVQATVAESSVPSGNATPSESRTRPAQRSSSPEYQSGRSIALSDESVTLGTSLFQFLDATIEMRSPEAAGLAIDVRLTNRGGSAINFSNDDFRLLVDDVPRAPTGTLNKIVYAHSAEEGVVEFVFSRTASSLALQVRFRDDVTVIPIEW